MGLLTRWVFEASSWGHEMLEIAFFRSAPRFMELSLGIWGATLAWMVLLALREAGKASTPKLGNLDFRVFGGLVFVLWLGALAPLLLTHSSHLSHPLMGAMLAWLFWPALGERLRTWAQLLGPRLHCLLVGRGAPWGVGVGVVLLVFVQSYRRHLGLASGGKDLGLFHQSVWLLSRFEAPRNTVMGLHAFGDHMEFIDLLAAPLQWLWPDAGALLLFQALCVASGAVGVFLLARDKLSPLAGWVMAMVLVLGIDLQHAVMFDFNPTTCAVGFFPWIVWAFERSRWALFGFALLLTALCKENMVVYAAALCGVLAWDAENPRRRWALMAMGVLLCLFVVEIKLIFPLFREQGFRHFRFGSLGNSWAELSWAVVRHPWEAVSLLWTPERKIDGLLTPLSSLAFLSLFAPRFMFALAPGILERFWSDQPNRWWGHHYGAGLWVLAVLGALYGLQRIRDRRWRIRSQKGWLAPEAAATREPSWELGAVLFSCILLAQCGHFGAGSLLRFNNPYYVSGDYASSAASALAVIPQSASVAAQNHLLPHLSARREIYELKRPIVADYVALELGRNAWPFPDRYPRKLARALLKKDYRIAACEQEVVILKRKGRAREKGRSCAALP